MTRPGPSTAPPCLVATFSGKRAAESFFGRPVVYGRQDEKIGETAIFVLPSTSGAARRYWDEAHWRGLAHFVRHAEAP